MSRSLLALAVCAAAAVHAEPLPLISNDAKYCVKPDVCDTVIVTAINSPDAALNAYADGLFNSADDAETAAEYRFTGFDHAALEAWITRVNEWRTGRIGLIKEHSPLQARMRVEDGRIVARMTGRERGGREVAGGMADVLDALVQHFEAPLPA